MTVLAGMPSSRAASRLVKPSGTVARTTARTPISADTRTVAAWVRNGSRSDGRPGACLHTRAVISLHDSLIPQRGLDGDRDQVRLVGHGAIAAERPRKFTFDNERGTTVAQSRHSSPTCGDAPIGTGAHYGDSAAPTSLPSALNSITPE